MAAISQTFSAAEAEGKVPIRADEDNAGESGPKKRKSHE